MSNPVETARNFFKNPDADSLAKSRFAYYYFGLYLKIIDQVRNGNRGRRGQIVYIDFFAGAGKYGTGEESVPLKVLESGLKLNNIRFIFNDLYLAEDLEQNIKDKFGYKELPPNIRVMNQNANDICIKSLFNSNDIVISYIDSFSYQLCDVRTICKLIENQLSDTVVFINTEHFYRFVAGQAKEEPGFVKFFGSKETYDHFKERYRTAKRKDDVTLELLKDFIKRLNTEFGKKLSYLPIFFRKDEENSNISQILIVISKNSTGPKKVRERFTEVKKDEEIRGKFNQNFYFENGKMMVYIDSKRDQMSLFDEDYEKYKGIIKYLPNEKATAITADVLLQRIDEDCTKRYLYLSGYTSTFLRRALKYFEERGEIEIDYRPKNNKRRPQWSYGKCTYIYATRRKGNENNN